MAVVVVIVVVVVVVVVVIVVVVECSIELKFQNYQEGNGGLDSNRDLFSGRICMVAKYISSSSKSASA